MIEKNTIPLNDVIVLPEFLDGIAGTLSEFFKAIGVSTISAVFSEVPPPTSSPAEEETSPFVEVPILEAMPDVELPAEPEPRISELSLNSQDIVSDLHSVAIHVEILSELAVELMGLEGLKLVLNPAGCDVVVHFEKKEFTGIGLVTGVGLRISPDYLRPMKTIIEDGKTRVEIDNTKEYVQVNVAEAVFAVDKVGNIRIEGGLGIAVQDPVMIGDTGIILENLDMELVLSGNGQLPPGAPPNGKGLLIRRAGLRIPEVFDGLISVENLWLGSGGVSGNISGNFPISYNGTSGQFTGQFVGEVFGMAGGLERIDLSLQQNLPSGGSIGVKLLLPFFEATDKPLDANVFISGNGEFSVEVVGENGILMLEKQGILRLGVNSLGFGHRDNTWATTISGSMKPLFGKIDWPEFQVNALIIDSHGKVKVEGGWINLPSNLTADFNGFLLEISRLGFGTEDDGSRWIGLSGAITIVDGVPMRGAVEGLKIIWAQDGSIRFEIKGIKVAFLIEDVLYFDGKVVFIDEPTKKGFKGAIQLVLYALEGMSIDAQFIAGKNTLSPPFKFFYIYLGIELPVGIPLGSTGLSLYGMAGLFGYNMTVNKGLPPNPADEAWFENDDGSPGFYKRGTPGVTGIDKWTDVRDLMAFGAGITLGTGSDNGYTLAAKILLAVLIPGPVILVEGKIGILQDRAKLNDNSILRLLAVLDPRSGTYLLNVDMRWKLPENGKTLDIVGGAEAFFTSGNPNAWHFYLGQRTPVSKRIRAKILSLFDANTYFMIDASGIEIGTWIGFDRSWKFGPARLKVAVWIEGIMALNYKPAQAWGSLTLNGNIEAKIFGKGVKLLIYSSLAAKVPTPWFVRGVLRVEIGLPWPLPDIEGEAVLEWKEELPPPIPVPLAKIGIEHLIVSEKWELVKYPVYDTDSDGFFDGGTVQAELGDVLANVPVVPMDARPVITFNKPVADLPLIGNTVSSDPSPEQVDEYDFRYRLISVVLEKRPKEGGSSWQVVAGKGIADDSVPELNGEWQIIPEDDATNVKLMLWANSPFEISRDLDSNQAWLYGAMEARRNPVVLIPSGGGYPCHADTEPQDVCVDFEMYEIDARFLPVLVNEAVLFFSFLYPMRIVRSDEKWGRTKKSLTLDYGIKNYAITVDLHNMYVDKFSGVVLLPAMRFVAAQGPGGERGKIDIIETDPLKPYVTLNSKGIDFRAGKSPCLAFDIQQFGFRPQQVILKCYSDTSLDVVAYDGRGNMVDQHRFRNGTGNWKEVGLNGEEIHRIEFVGQKVSVAEIQYTFPDRKEMVIVCPEDVHSLDLFLARGSDIQWKAFDRDANEQGGGNIKVASTIAEEDMASHSLTVDDGVFRTVLISGIFRLHRVCYVLAEEEQRVKRNETINQHNRESATERWTNTAPLLDPNHYYRLRVATETQWRKGGGGWNTQRFEESAYFQTGFPPGVTQAPRSSWMGVEREYDQAQRLKLGTSGTFALQLGSGTEAIVQGVADEVGQTVAESPSDPNPDRYPMGGPLKDLGPYIQQTVPQEVASNEPKRFHYRSYDIGIMFNEPEEIVRQMYLMAGLDLTIRLFDNNSDPAVDPSGNRIVLQNIWAKASELVLRREESQWRTYLDENCSYQVEIDSNEMVKSANFYSGHRKLNLYPRTPYKAKLFAGEQNVVFQWNFVTSKYSNFIHHAHSFNDTVWEYHALNPAELLSSEERTALGEALSSLTFKTAFEPSDYRPDFEGTLFEQLYTLFFNEEVRQLPEDLEVLVLNEADTRYGFLLESSEPIDWERTTVALKAKDSAIPVGEFDGPVKLIHANLTNHSGTDYNNEYVSMLLIEDLDLTGFILKKKDPVTGNSEVYFTFGEEEKLPSGTIINVRSGKASDFSGGNPEHENRHVVPDDDAADGTWHFDTDQGELEVWNKDGHLVHSKVFLNYSTEGDKRFKLIRNKDQTRAFIFLQAGLADRRYRIEFSFSREPADIVEEPPVAPEGVKTRYRDAGRYDQLSRRTFERQNKASIVDRRWEKPVFTRTDFIEDESGESSDANVESTYIEFSLPSRLP